MRTEIYDLKIIDKQLSAFGTELTFRPFIEFLKERMKEESVKSAVYQNLVWKFENELSGAGIDIHESEMYKEFLDLVYMVLTPLASSEASHLWALSTPVPSKIFYSTNAFADFHISETACSLEGVFDTKSLFSISQKAFIYRLALNRFYDIDAGLSSESFIQGKHPETGQPLYYKLHVDTRFIHIAYHGTLPELNRSLFETGLLNQKEEEYLEEELPLSMIELSGFSILEFTDVTAQHAVENLKDYLVDQTGNPDFKQVNISLQNLIGSMDINFGFIPFARLNGRAVYLPERSHTSVLLALANREAFERLVQHYEKNTDIAIYQKAADQATSMPFLFNILDDAHIQTYVLVPVVQNKNLLGLLELHSTKELSFTRAILSRLQPAMPYLTQLMQQIIQDFENSIEHVIHEKFTSLKSAVKWKFNEAAWQYLQDSATSGLKPVPRVSFQQVYPIYGAIDVRHSTQERNEAVFLDSSVHIRWIEKTLDALKEYLKEEEQTQLIEKRISWDNVFKSYFETKDEFKLVQLIQSEINPYFDQIYHRSADTDLTIDAYFAASSSQTGIVYRNRRELELSMQRINDQISVNLLASQKELQQLFPHYFEKFRTDGVEYDIYMGQSIAPEQNFEQHHIRTVRLWQLKNMAEIGASLRNLKPHLPKPLSTTQLIYVHSSPIDITFRDDEKLFDVEGGYSIRYEIVKKRIDKVLIKGTGERLTQPEKIAIVYMNDVEKEEYLDYIRELQDLEVLRDDLELLDLEDLQGVTGLKAFRMGIS
ncbi:hypothetical protein [Desertivirga xinjiangensis]|uniref:hypothetical protein n=1 Tax=Desertivirga xinjiangensis TaxID=539206 RepID=UPI002108E725|nr:hypothetical protein [Pedobacter xinjiangensis]